MTDDDLDAIEARANAATPGPWEWKHPVYGPEGDMYAQSAPDETDYDDEPVYHAIITTDSGFCGPNDADRAFIAHARDDVPALLAEVRRLRDLVQRCSHSEEGRGEACEPAPFAVTRDPDVPGVHDVPFGPGVARYINGLLCDQQWQEIVDAAHPSAPKGAGSNDA